MKLVRLLHDLGANVETPVSKGYFEGRTPLWMAAKNGHVEVVRLLHELGASASSAEMQ